MSQQVKGSRGPRILIIDDEKSLTDAIADVLSMHFKDVLVAQSAKEGKKMAKEEEPDLILLDYYLGDGTGKQVFLELAKHRRTKHIPIIFISAHSLAEHEIKGIDKELTFLRKPFTIHELYELLSDKVLPGS